MTPEQKAWLDEYQFPYGSGLYAALVQFMYEFHLEKHEAKRVLLEWMEEL